MVNILLIVWVDQWVPAYPLPSNDHFSPSHRQNTKKKIYIYIYTSRKRERKKKITRFQSEICESFEGTEISA